MRTPPESYAETRWWCVTCRPQTELLAQRVLVRSGHDVFVPTETRFVRRRRNAPRIRRQIPLVPGCILLAAVEEATAWVAVHSTTMLRGLLMQRPVRDNELARLRAISGLEAIRLDRHERRPLQPGAVVRILSGPFVDFEGALQALRPEHDDAVVVVVLFGRQQEVIVPIADVRPVAKLHAA